MKNKLWRIGKALYVFIFILALFTLIRIVAIAFYQIKQADGNYTLAMMLMDRGHQFNLTSYVKGWLHGWVVWVMLKIMFDK